MTNTNVAIKVVSTEESKIPESHDNGSIYFAKDTKNLFYDLGDKRTQISDVCVVETKTQAEAMENNSIPYKFYYVKESHELFFRGTDENDLWHNIFPAEVDYDFGTYND